LPNSLNRLLSLFHSIAIKYCHWYKFH
jgi:hypothetical protein